MRALRFAVILLASACASSPPADPAGPGITVVGHLLEIPRNPAPGYHADGVAVTGLEGDSPFARAGLRVGDVIQEVNGHKVWTEDQFWKRAGEGVPSKVTLVRSRAMPSIPFLRLDPTHPPTVTFPLPAPASGDRYVEIRVRK